MNEWAEFSQLGKKLADEHRAQGHTVWLHNRGIYDFHIECFTCYEMKAKL